MIRLAQKKENQILTRLWLKTTTLSHPFIPMNFWRRRAKAIEDNFLPQSVTYVDEEAGEIIGFISFMRKGFIGGLFVAKEQQRKGIGTLFINHAKKNFTSLELDVYVKNKQALAFYKKQGFSSTMVHMGEKTGENSFRMRWER
ncbi:MAG: N-acetyltransferase [Acidaminococcaceae bacterium]|nr:N-acetyltransferase [Acidaminococcaceae bacterium]